MYVYINVCMLSGSTTTKRSNNLTTLNMTSLNCIHESMKVNIIVKKKKKIGM